MLIRSGVDAASFNKLLSTGWEHAVEGATLMQAYASHLLYLVAYGNETELGVEILQEAQHSKIFQV